MLKYSVGGPSNRLGELKRWEANTSVELGRTGTGLYEDLVAGTCRHEGQVGHSCLPAGALIHPTSLRAPPLNIIARAHIPSTEEGHSLASDCGNFLQIRRPILRL